MGGFVELERTLIAQFFVDAPTNLFNGTMGIDEMIKEYFAQVF